MESLKVHPEPSGRAEAAAVEPAAGQNGLDLAADLQILKIGVYFTLAKVTDNVDELKNKLKNMLTTFGVVSALLLSMTYSATVNPFSLVSPDLATDPLSRAFTILTALAALLSLIVIISCAVLIAEIDLCCGDDDVRGFIQRFQRLFEGIIGLFGISILAIVTSVILSSQINYQDLDPLTANLITYFYIGGTVLVAVCSGLVATYTRGRLMARLRAGNSGSGAVNAKVRQPPLLSAKAHEAAAGGAAGAGPASAQDVQELVAAMTALVHELKAQRNR